MRKEVTLPIETENGSVVLTFRRFRLKEEDIYRKWLRQQIVEESKESIGPVAYRNDVLSGLLAQVTVGSCSLTGAHGIVHALQGAGMREFLRLAAYESHPDLKHEDWYEIICDHHKECVEIVKQLLPVEIKEQPDGFFQKTPSRDGSLSST